ncbi:MMPL family transporter [Nocardia seriolae]|uniref:MMPL family transporter n=1 Tax=Nocardia seriolae TaxID=37332 RepID=UPI0009E4A0A9|nr:MMPL family transporter [Nocardia seriolae]
MRSTRHGLPSDDPDYGTARRAWGTWPNSCTGWAASPSRSAGSSSCSGWASCPRARSARPGRPALPPDSFAIPGTESQQAFDLLGERFPGTESDGAQARIVFVAPDGQQITSDANRAAVERVIADASGGGQVKGVLDPFQTGAVSKNGSTAYATVSYGATGADLTDATKDALTSAVDKGRAEGLSVEIGGTALQAEPAMGGATEVVGIVIAAVVLMITFVRSCRARSGRACARTRFPKPVSR